MIQHAATANVQRELLAEMSDVYSGCSIVPVSRFVTPNIFALKTGGYGCLFLSPAWMRRA